MSFFSELQRRSVFRVAGLYTVVGWLLVEVAVTVEEAIELPPWFDAVVLSFLVILFPIALIFAWAFELTPDGIQRTPALDPQESKGLKSGSVLDVVLILSLLVFAGSLVATRLLPPDEQTRDSEVATAATDGSDSSGSEIPESADASIAVLPFADLSEEGNREYFADGISEEILNVLAKVQGMKVAGRTSSFAFKGRNEDLREIGSMLNVSHILEGSVRSQGEQVRVTAQLIQVSDGFHLWSETYDRELSDIFAVQDDIANQILVAMKARLMVDVAPRVDDATRTDIESYSRFLEARDLVFSRDIERMTRAIDLLNEAIEIDSGYAPSFALRAKAYMLSSDRPGSYGAIPALAAMRMASDDVAQALFLDYRLADGLAVQGLIAGDNGRPDFAIASLRRALEVNPNSLDARNWLALALSYSGRFREVAEELKRLVEIDPLYRPGVSTVMLYAQEVGDFKTARSAGERYVALTDDNKSRRRIEAKLALLDSDFSGAIRVYEAMGQDAGRDAKSLLRFLHLDLGITEAHEGSGAVLPIFEPYELAQQGKMQAALSRARENVRESPGLAAAHTVYIRTLAAAQEDEELVDYFERNYAGDLDAFATRLRPVISAESPPYKSLALSLRGAGKESAYAEAMRRWRSLLDLFREGGSVTPARDVEESAYLAMMGDLDGSLELLERALDKRRMLPVSVFDDRAYEALDADERFHALRAQNLEQVNQERGKLGFGSLTDAYYAALTDDK